MVNMMKKTICLIGLLLAFAMPVFANDGEESLGIASVTNSFSAKAGQKADIDLRYTKYCK